MIPLCYLPGEAVCMLLDKESCADDISSYVTFAPGSDTLAHSIARTNFMHNPYLQSGKIKNEDMLYVLFDNMYEPVRFMKLYEWRELSDMEVAAFATVWRYLGDMLEIDFKAELGKDEWKDGIEFFDDMVIWAKDFQMKHLEPSASITNLGETLRDLLLSAYPEFMRGPMNKILMVLVGERLRNVFGYVDGSPLFTGAILTRTQFCRTRNAGDILHIQFPSYPKICLALSHSASHIPRAVHRPASCRDGAYSALQVAQGSLVYACYFLVSLGSRSLVPTRIWPQDCWRWW